MSEVTDGSRGERLEDALIVCTRNRPLEVGRCLESVANQTRLPHVILVVDSSDDDATERVVGGRSFGPLADRLEYHRSLAGLTHQRNAGVALTRSDIVHFIDDDVVLEPGYIAAVMAAFSADERGAILGVGGLVTNAHHEGRSSLRRLFGLYGDRSGAVLASGRNVLAVDLVVDADVDWLSGCSMSYRRTLFDVIRFDEDLPGYGLGEDVEFSYRVRQHGRLLVATAARLVHLQSPTNRLTSVQYTRDELITRARRVRARTGRLRMRAFWLSVIGQVVGLLAASLGRPDRRLSLRRCMATVRTALAIAVESISRRPQLDPTTLVRRP